MTVLYTEEFDLSQMEGRKLTPEMLEWFNAVVGKKVDFYQEDNDGHWVVTVGDISVAVVEEREQAVTTWSHIKQQCFAMGILEGSKGQSRQWFAHGEGQKRSANSTGWTDL